MYGVRFLLLSTEEWNVSGGGHELRNHNEEANEKHEKQVNSFRKWNTDETAVDEQQSNENGRILSEVDKKVSFKSRDPEPI